LWCKVELLLRHGADISATNDDGVTAADCSVQDTINKEIINVLHPRRLPHQALAIAFIQVLPVLSRFYVFTLLARFKFSPSN